MKTAIICTLYDCSPKMSVTIKSLVANKNEFNNYELVIWNNGPKTQLIESELVDTFKKKNINVTYIETIGNAPLSWIYNYFLMNFIAEKYIIIDHDSMLTSQYLTAAKKIESFFVKLPIIQAQGAPRSPTINGKFLEGPFSCNQKVISIGSGILISKDAVNKIKSRYGSMFDERFALYGVDTSFFVRIYKAELSNRLETIPGFEHSLSRLEKESKAMTKFRKTERTYDFALMLRHYPSFGHLKSLVKQTFFLFLGRSRLDFWALINTLITGRHPRASETYRQDFIESLRKSVLKYRRSQQP